MNTSPDMSLQQDLQSLGLSQKQAEIYLSVCRKKQATVLQVARETGIQRPTIYENAAELGKMGLLVTILKGKKRYLEATDPENLYKLVEAKSKKARGLVEDLQKIEKGEKIHSPIRLYSGQEGARQLAEAILLAKKKTIYTLGSYQVLYDLFSEKDLRKLWEARNRRKIHVNVLFPSTDVSALRTNKDYSEVGNIRYERSVRILPTSMEFHVMYTIVDDQVLFWSAREEDFFFHFGSPSYATSLRSLFETLWQISTPLENCH